MVILLYLYKSGIGSEHVIYKTVWQSQRGSKSERGSTCVLYGLGPKSMALHRDGQSNECTLGRKARRDQTSLMVHR